MSRRSSRAHGCCPFPNSPRYGGPATATPTARLSGFNQCDARCPTCRRWLGPAGRPASRRRSRVRAAEMSAQSAFLREPVHSRRCGQRAMVSVTVGMARHANPTETPMFAKTLVLALVLRSASSATPPPPPRAAARSPRPTTCPSATTRPTPTATDPRPRPSSPRGRAYWPASRRSPRSTERRLDLPRQ